MQDFTDIYPDVEPIVRWVLPNAIRGHAPVQAQGFLGVFEGRPDMYWFPDQRIGYTVSLEFTYETLEEARAVALKGINERIDALLAAKDEVMAVKA